MKRSTADSTTLPDHEKKRCPKDTYFFVVKWEHAENDHLKVTLSHGAGIFYVYDPHWYFPPTDGEVVQKYPQYASGSKKLTDKDLVEAAKYLDVPLATLKAVLEVEVNYFKSGGGFLKNGKPKILFEAHWFSHFTQGQYNMTHPDISSKRWNRDLYIGGAGEWKRFEKAARLDFPASVQSASWGLGQVMGLHWKLCGFNSPRAFYDAQFVNEYEQLKCMLKFLRAKKLDKHLRSLNFAAFAYGYNGESYRVNRYDEKLLTAYNFYA